MDDDAPKMKNRHKSRSGCRTCKQKRVWRPPHPCQATTEGSEEGSRAVTDQNNTAKMRRDQT